MGGRRTATLTKSWSATSLSDTLTMYPVSDGVITCRGKNILTKEEFGDFIFRCEFKLPPGGNNGISIRGDLEIQVLDHYHPQYGKDFNDGQGLHAYQYNGSVYGVVPARRTPEKNDYLRPVGEWSCYEIRVFGSKVKVILNDEIINDTDLKDYRDKPSLSGGNYKGLSQLTGSVGFLGHSDPVQFRNIRIKAKILETREGKSGGVRLVKKPVSITVLQLIELFDGKPELADCTFRKKLCPNRKTCVLRKPDPNQNSNPITNFCNTS